MPKLIKNGEVTENTWHLLAKEADVNELNAISAEKILVPVTFWQANKEALKQLDASIGLWFDSDENPASLVEAINDFPLIALNFPVFRDGRAFSYAAILRQQLGFKGELMAIGDVLRVQLSYMLSCGFSSFLVDDDADTQILLAGFHDFSENYQSTTRKPTPIFRRR